MDTSTEVPQERIGSHEELYGWLFHNNHFTGEWNAFLREEHTQYFNGEATTVVSSISILALILSISEAGGSVKETRRLLKDPEWMKTIL